MKAPISSLVLIACCACSPTPQTGNDAGTGDSGTLVDAGRGDAGPAVDAGARDSGASSDSGIADGGASSDAAVPDSGPLFSLIAPEPVGTFLDMAEQISWIHVDGGFITVFGGNSVNNYPAITLAFVDDNLRTRWWRDITPPLQTDFGRPELVPAGANVDIFCSGFAHVGFSLGTFSWAAALDPDGGSPTYVGWETADQNTQYFNAPASSTDGGVLLMSWTHGGRVLNTLHAMTMAPDAAVLTPDTVFEPDGGPYATAPWRQDQFILARYAEPGGNPSLIVSLVGPDLVELARRVIPIAVAPAPTGGVSGIATAAVPDGGVFVAWIEAPDGGLAAVQWVQDVFAGAAPQLVGWTDAGIFYGPWTGVVNGAPAVTWISSGAPGPGQVSFATASSGVINLLPAGLSLPLRAMPRVWTRPSGLPVLTLGIEDAGQGQGIYALPFAAP